MKTDARWRATTHQKLGKVVMVDATLKSRTRNTQTIHEAGLVKDPGWPRWFEQNSTTPISHSSTLPPFPWTLLVMEP